MTIIPDGNHYAFKIHNLTEGNNDIEKEMMRCDKEKTGRVTNSTWFYATHRCFNQVAIKLEN